MLSEHVREPSWKRAERLFRAGLFGFAFVVSKDVNVSPATLAFSMLVELLQMLAFPLNSSARMPWGRSGTAVARFSTLLNYVTTDTFDVVASPSAFLAMLSASIAWTATFVCASLTVAWSFSQQMQQMPLLLHALRSIAWLSTTVLFLPLLSVLLRGFACPEPSDWMETGTACYTGSHLALVTLLVLLVPVVVFLSVFTATTIFASRSLQGTSLDRRVTARADFYMLAIKIVLTFLYNVVPDSFLGTWLHSVLLVASAAAWVLLYLRWRPYVDQAVNDAQVASGATYLWACCMLAVAQLEPAGAKTSYTGALLAGGCLAALGGRALSRSRYLAVVHAPLQSLRTMPDVGSWLLHHVAACSSTAALDEAALEDAIEPCQALLRHALTRSARVRGGMISLLAARLSGPGAHARPYVSASTDEPDGAQSPAEAEWRTAGRGTSLEHTPARRPGELRISVAADAQGDVPTLPLPPPSQQALMPSAAPASDEAAAREVVDVLRQDSALARAAMKEAHVDAATRAVRFLVESFPANENAWVVAAEFHRAFARNSYMERLMLHRASMITSSIGAKFYLFQRRQQMREDEDQDRLSANAPRTGGTAALGREGDALRRKGDAFAMGGASLGAGGRKGLSAIDRVMFDQYKEQARRLRMDALRSQASLWEVLGDEVTDVSNVQRVGITLQALLRRIEDLYRAMLGIAPDSVAVLREYGTFLEELTNRKEQAQQVLNRAQRLEETKSQAVRATAAEVVVGAMVHGGAIASGDAAAVIFSGDPHKMGEILELTNSVLVLFGVPMSSTLVGQNISVLLAAPLRAGLAEKLAETAERGQHLDSTWVLLCQRYQSHSLFPARVALRQGSPPKDGLEPRLVLMIEPLRSSDHLFLVGDEAERFPILGADTATAALCDIGLGDLGEGGGMEAHRTHIPGTSFLPALSRAYRDIANLESPDADTDDHALDSPGPDRRAVPVPDAAERHRRARGTGEEKGAAEAALREAQPPALAREVKSAQASMRRNAAPAATQLVLHSLLSMPEGQATVVRVQPPGDDVGWALACMRQVPPEWLDHYGGSARLHVVSWFPLTVTEVAGLAAAACRSGPGAWRLMSTRASDAGDGHWGAAGGGPGAAAFAAHHTQARSLPLRPLPALRGGTAPAVAGPMAAMRALVTQQRELRALRESKVPARRLPQSDGVPPGGDLDARVGRSRTGGGGDGEAQEHDGTGSGVSSGAETEGEASEEDRAPASPPGRALSTPLARADDDGPVPNRSQRIRHSPSRFQQPSQRHGGPSGQRTPQADEDAASVGSGGSSSSRLSGMSTEALQQTLDDRGREHEPEILRMRRVLVFINVMCVCLGAAGVAFTEATSPLIARRILATRESNARYSALQFMHFAFLQNDRAQSAASSAALLLGPAAYARQAVAYRSALEAAHLAAVDANIASAGPPREFDIMPTVTFVSPRAGRAPGVRNLTIIAAVAQVVSLALTVSSQPERALASLPEYALLVQNHASVHASANASTFLTLQDTSDATVFIMALQLVLLVVSFTGIVVLSATLFIHEIKSLHARVSNVYKVLLVIPMRVVRYVRAYTLQQQEVAAEEDDAQEGELDDESQCSSENDDGDEAASGGARQPGGLQRGGEPEDGPEQEAGLASADGPLLIPVDRLSASAWRTLVQAKRPPKFVDQLLRPHADSSNFVVRSAVRVTLPLVLVGAWIGGMYVYHLTEALASMAHVQRAVAMDEAYRVAVGGTAAMWEACTALNATTAGAGGAAGAVHGAEAAMERAAAVLLAVQYGGALPAMHGRLTAAVSLRAYSAGLPASAVALGSVCSASNSEACAAFAGGLLADRSYFEAFELYASHVASALRQLDLGAAGPELCSTLTVALQLARGLEDPHLRLAKDHIVAALFAAVEDSKRTLRRNTVISCIVFVLAFTVYNISVYWPLISSLSTTLRSVRSLLLLVPNRVLSVPVVRSAFRDVLRDVRRAERASRPPSSRAPRHAPRRTCWRRLLCWSPCGRGARGASVLPA